MFAVLSEVPLFVVNIGNLHLAIYLSQIVYLVVAAVVGIVAEFIVGWRLPFGVIGAIIVALAGMWMVNNLVTLIIPGDPVVGGVPLFKALVGAIVLVALWHLITYPLWFRRHRFSERRAQA